MGFELVSLLPGIPMGKSLGAYMESYKIQLIGSLIKEVSQIQPGGRTNLNLPPQSNSANLPIPTNFSLKDLALPDFKMGVTFDKAMASELVLSLEAKNMITLAHELFDTPDQRAENVKLLIELHRDSPPLWKPALVLLSVLKEAGAKGQDLSQALKLIESLATIVKSQPIIAKTELSGLNLFAKQAIMQISATVALQKSLPVEVRLTPKQIVDFFAQALQERPATFEKEVFSFPLIQSAGITPKEYLAVVDEVDPLKLALLLLNLKSQKSPLNAGEELKHFVVELKKMVSQGQPFKATFEGWEAKAQLSQSHPLVQPYYPAEQSKIPLKFIAQGLTWLAQGKELAVVAQALSPELGVLPDGAWQLQMPGAALLSIQGGLFMAQHLGTGLNRVKFKVAGDDDDTLVDLFLYCVQGLSDEEEQERNKHPKEDQANQSFEDEVVPDSALGESPFGGEISINLVSPFILTRPYGENEPVKAPLMVKFRFLADLLDPNTLLSREKYLTLKASPTVARLREAVKDLGTQGLPAYDTYLQTLNQVFELLRSFIPQVDESFLHAQKFLRDEVLLYFMGKKSMVECRPLQFAQKTPRGDVIAGICAVTSELMRKTGQESDALVEIVDASHWAQTKPQYLNRLREFFDTLRSRMGPSNTNTPTLALASEFAQNVTIL